MILKAFSIRDAKANAFIAPWYKPTHGEAERYFHQLANDEKSMIKQYPEDFDLYHVGEYDDQTGIYKSLDQPQHLVKATQLLGQ